MAAKIYKDSFMACKLAPPLHRSIRRSSLCTEDPEDPEDLEQPEELQEKMHLPEKQIMLDDVDSKSNGSKLSDKEKTTAI